MRKYKTIMELIFIFLIPLILILSGINLKEEQITTSNGYEWNTYIEYNNKILVEMGEYKNVIQNFNIWDEQTEIGYLWNGNNVNSDTTLRSKNYTKVSPNTTYYVQKPRDNLIIAISYYDINKTSLTNGSGITLYGSVKTFTTPSNAEYIKFWLNNDYGTTYKNDICINISITWANGNYEPYGEPLILYTNTDVSGQNDRTYTSFGAIKNLILNNFKIQQNTTTNILFDYTILWFLMFILWHVLYLFFDMLIHLFVDWGHKEKEKTNG